MEHRKQNIESHPAPISADEASQFRGIDVAIVLPALNEEAGLVRTLDDIPFSALRRTGWNVRPLLVDGGSTDRTCEIARERGVAVLHQQSRGKGAAIRETLAFLAEHDVRYAVFLDADYTYPGGAIPAVVELLVAGSQLAIGVREPVRAANDDAREFVHRLGNRILNLTASQLSGLPILDLCSGFWAVDVRAITPLRLETNGFEIEAELFTKACRAGYTLSQIPIPYRERLGVAKLHAVRDGVRILLTTIRHGRRTLATGFAMPSPNRFRDLLTVAMMYQHTDYLLVADASRRAEAQQVARRISAARPDKSVRVEFIPSTRTGEVPASRTPRAVTIHLPSIAGTGESASPYAIVHLPRSDRLIAVAPGSFSPTEAATLARSGGFEIGPAGLRLEYAPDGTSTVDRVRAIFANTFPSPSAKELAYLGANGHFGPIAVWRTRGPIGDPTASFPDIKNSLAADPSQPAPVPERRTELSRIESSSAVLVDEGLP
jgi:hypothetical protein